MTPWLQDNDVTVYHGDCLHVMAEMDEASVAAIVCDPPYGLEFMGKEWDSFAPTNSTSRVQRGATGGFGSGKMEKFRTGTRGVKTTFKCRTCGGWSGSFSAARAARQRKCECESPDYEYGGATSQMTAFQAWCEAWGREALRVLKPGGHLLAFGGTRTSHRLVCGLEDAGFEIRDSLVWLYGSGFPKSLDVSKAIDKAAGAEREVVGADPEAARRNKAKPRFNGTDYAGGQEWQGAPTVPLTAPATEDAARWKGWGTALKPAHEPVVVARKPLGGTVAGNVLAHGVGALNIDGCRIAHANAADLAESEGKNQHSRYANPGSNRDSYSGNMPPRETYSGSAGRWPANVVLDEQAAGMLDEQTGERPSNSGTPFNRRDVGYHGGCEPTISQGYYGDTGGPSRYFYTAKADAAERRGSKHPTVKPLDLMRWLVRLVTPPGGLVLDPFAGSGTTLEAARAEGFRAVGIEREAEYLPDIAARLAQLSLLGGAA